MIPINKLQNLPCKKKTKKQKQNCIPKYPGQRARGKSISHNITRILSKQGTRTNMAPLRQSTVHFEITRPRFKFLPLLFVWPWASHLPFLGSLYRWKRDITCLSYLKELLERSNEIMWYIMTCKALHKIIQTYIIKTTRCLMPEQNTSKNTTTNYMK